MSAANSPPLLFVVFGLPGAGKSFVARRLGRRGFFVHDGDDDLPDDMRGAIERGEVITVEMRDRFMAALADHVVALAALHPRLVVAQTFLKAQHRAQLAARLPHARFVQVIADDELRRTRLAHRSHQPLSAESVDRMIAAFDVPGDDDDIEVIHNGDDPANLEAQIDLLLASTQ